MPKIRGVKPDYWTDEDIMELSIPARLLFIGLWNYACDNGHLQDKPKQIKMRILPGDDVNCAELIRELASAGRIVRGDGVITIPNFGRHQKPDKRYFQTCELTLCEKPNADSQRETRGAPHESPTSARSGLVVGSTWPPGDGEVKGSDGDSDGEGDSREAAPRTKPKTRLPKDWKPTNEHLERAVTAGISLGAEAEKFKLHAESVDRRAANWNAAFTQWLIKAAEWAAENRPAKPRALPQARTLLQPPDGLNDAELSDWYATNGRHA